ncbi:MAG: caspase family protein [Prevotella sp.]|nr:caspase family protein [Prevotella sp.]
MIIPAVVYDGKQEYKVKSVSTFLNGVNYLAETLVLEEGIEEIDKFAFNEFRKLQSATLPSTIKHVGKNAFRNNIGLTFAIASTSIDEYVLRNGTEYWNKGNNNPTINNKPLVAQKQNDEHEALKREQEELKKQLEETQKEKDRLLAEAKKRDKEEKKAAKANKEESTGGIAGKMLAMVKGKGKKGSTTENENTPVMASTQQQTPSANTTVNKTQKFFADVDKDIPVVTTDKNADTYCVILANEKYEDVPEVEYAARDGEYFKEYCVKTLGIPEKQIKMFVNASYTDIKRALNWMEQISNVVTNGQCKMIFYYAGHGIPNEKDKAAYLIPVDGFPKDVTTCFKLSDLYARLANMKTQNVTVFLDACFSGVKRGSGQALVAARGVAIKPKADALTGNMVVFSATSDDETALAYQEKQHGMFTYYLLDKIKQSKGKLSLGELFDSVSQNVRKSSMLENDKLQTPSVNVSASMKDQWRKMNF